jgi:oligoribonuclease NrnB/cAMP/cGMP phosphodiesterase (DHH superfamily)
MVKITLSNQEELLVKKVCELQLDSFQRILNGQKEAQVQEKLIEHHVTEKELKEMITDVVRQYIGINSNPESLFHEFSDLLNNFREALDFNTDSLKDFNELIAPLMNKLDLAIYIFRHRN